MPVRGALANAIVDARRDLDVYAVDLRDRPSGLDDDVAWCRDLWDVDADRWTSGEAEVVLATLDRPTLILAVDWLDDLPCTIAARDAGGVLRQVEVDPNGVEGGCDVERRRGRCAGRRRRRGGRAGRHWGGRGGRRQWGGRAGQ